MVNEARFYRPKAPQYAYIEQLCPIKMNCEQILTTVAANKDFIPTNSLDGIPVGLLASDITKLEKAYLLIIGRAVNSFDGENYLDCSTATHNQWQVNIDGGDYQDLQNAEKVDGQMLNTDWECYAQGIIHPFTFMFDITSLITAVTNHIGVRLANGRSIQDSLIVTLDIYSKFLWRL